jgi:hypothetical protein
VTEHWLAVDIGGIDERLVVVLRVQDAVAHHTEIQAAAPASNARSFRSPPQEHPGMPSGERWGLGAESWDRDCEPVLGKNKLSRRIVGSLDGQKSFTGQRFRR